MNILNKIKEAFVATKNKEQNTETNSDKPFEAEMLANTPDISSKNETYGLPPAPKKREEILQFIMNCLRPYTDEKITGIKGIEFFIYCEDSLQQELAKVALYYQTPNKFKNNELERKLANQYIRLQPNWFFTIQLCHDCLPDCQHRQGLLGLNIITEKAMPSIAIQASLITLSGQTSQQQYHLNIALQTSYHIGRGINPQLSSGSLHTNHIIFLSKSDLGFDAIKGTPNAFVSRNHAIIKYNDSSKKFYLYADQGGLPENGNKTKIFKTDNTIIRIDIEGVAHELENGDQIELGGEAKLLFTTQVK